MFSIKSSSDRIPKMTESPVTQSPPSSSVGGINGCSICCLISSNCLSPIAIARTATVELDAAMKITINKTVIFCLICTRLVRYFIPLNQ